MWLIGVYIPPYGPASRENHEPERPRKLLLHRAEIERLIGRTQERGLTLVPTRIYFSGPRSRAKIEIALARGKDLYDKRETIRKRDMARDVQRELREVAQRLRSGRRTWVARRGLVAGIGPRSVSRRGQGRADP